MTHGSQRSESAGEGGLTHFAIGIIYLTLCGCGWMRFSIWDSVREFCNYDPHHYLSIPVTTLLSDPWGIRTGLAVPSLLLAEYLNMNQEHCFAMFAGSCVLGTTYLVCRTADDVTHATSRARDLIVLLLFIGLSYFMNGRITFAFLGAAMLLHAHSRWFSYRIGRLNTAVTTFFGLILMVVSSGTFYVGCVTLVTWCLFALFDLRTPKARRRLHVRAVAVLTPLLWAATYQATLFQEKLSRWHDGDYMQLVYHGPGEFLEKYITFIDPALGVGLIMMGGTLALVIWLSCVSTYPPFQSYMITLLLLSVPMGLCGWSTLATNLPTLVLFGLKWNKSKTMVASQQSMRNA